MNLTRSTVGRHKLGVFALAFACSLVLSPTTLWADATPQLKVSDDKISYSVGDRLVTEYLFDKERPKPHFHPINGPYGQPVTRGYPMVRGISTEKADHRHHRAAWFCHGDVIPEGITLTSKRRGVEGVDFWAEGRGTGKIVCVKVGDPQVNGNHFRVTTWNEWRTPDDVKILDETRTLHFFNIEPTQLIVLEIDLHASVVPITFGDTKEGSMGVRVAGTMKESQPRGTKGGLITNAKGTKGALLSWGRYSDWCDYSGPVDGKTVGLTIFDHPDNTYRACWHARNYGLMAANPFGRRRSGFPDMRENREEAKLPKGDHLRLRYGLLVHPGDAEEGNVTEHYQKFVDLDLK